MNGIRGAHHLALFKKTFRSDCERALAPRRLTPALAAWWLVINPGLRAVFWLRVMGLMWDLDLPMLASLVRLRNVRAWGFDAVPGAKVGPGFLVKHPSGIVIGRDVVIGARVTLLQGVTLGEQLSPGGEVGYPVLGDDVVVGANASILGSLTIARGARVGANAVVLMDVPEGVTVVGIPARPQRRRD